MRTASTAERKGEDTRQSARAMRGDGVRWSRGQSYTLRRRKGLTGTANFRRRREPFARPFRVWLDIVRWVAVLGSDALPLSVGEKSPQGVSRWVYIPRVCRVEPPRDQETYIEVEVLSWRFLIPRSGHSGKGRGRRSRRLGQAP